MEEVRDSLDYRTYIMHADLHKLSGDEMMSNFLEINKKPYMEVREKPVAFFRTTKLLYALSLELILKARGLYIEKEKIKTDIIKDFNDFLKSWKGKTNGHDMLKLIEHYKINLTQDEEKLLENYSDFMVWAGRFPYPKHEEKTKKMELGGFSSTGNLGEKDKILLSRFIEKQKTIMGYE